MYGGSPVTLYEKLKQEDAVDESGNPITKEKAQEYYDKYFTSYAGVADFIKNQKKFAHKHNCIYTLIGRKRRLRSEEHTSELQSRQYLVCRLLLEKKKNTKN